MNWLVTNSDGSLLDASVFNSNDLNVDSPKEIYIFSEDDNKSGDYILKFKVFRSSYPAVTHEREFNLKIYKKCEAPNSLTPSLAPQGLEYTVSEMPVLSHVLLPFTADPPDCTVTYAIS